MHFGKTASRSLAPYCARSGLAMASERETFHRQSYSRLPIGDVGGGAGGTLDLLQHAKHVPILPALYKLFICD